MQQHPITFSCEAKDKRTLARAGTITTPHGVIETPAFVSVGTKGTVKSLKPEDLRDYAGAQVMLANTYHLFLQPGHDCVEAAGGLSAFSNWHGPTMTDSGGFQIFSLGAGFGESVSKFLSEPSESQENESALNVYTKEAAAKHGKLCVIDEEGVTFTSHIDGSMHRFTAERSIEIQHAIKADMIFAFDECPPPTAHYEYERGAMERTHRWAKRSLLAHKQNYEALKTQGLFGIVQGGRFLDLRRESAEMIGNMDFAGYGIGGSFDKHALAEPIRTVCEILPAEKPRHLLGIGELDDITAGVQSGCDLFDCVLPTRIARNGTVYQRGSGGYTKINLFNATYRRDFSPIDADCTCYTCTHYTRAYLAHLFRAREMLGPHLATIHNLFTTISHTESLRARILRGETLADG